MQWHQNKPKMHIPLNIGSYCESNQRRRAQITNNAHCKRTDIRKAEMEGLNKNAAKTAIR